MSSRRFGSALLFLGLTTALPALLGGCLGSQRQGPLGGISPEQAFTEAYVEYSGPASRWAGPTSFLLHVSAKPGERVSVRVAPRQLFDSKGDAVEIRSRVPAGAEFDASGAMRERLAALAETIETGSEPFHGCAHPVRVRMIRADGSLKEWEGCRSTQGWPKAVSEFTDSVLKEAASG